MRISSKNPGYRQQTGEPTVGLLKARMKELELSPEKLAEIVPLSNMTIRRLLSNPDTTKLQEKHRVLLESVLSTSPSIGDWLQSSGDLSSLVVQLEADGAKVDDITEIKTQLKSKLRLVSKDMVTLAKSLWEHASKKNAKRTLVARSIAIGAILYFINPFDLIPDSIPVVGYLDDFAVMTLALSKIHKLVAK